jgi:hypothetical protein
MCQWSNRLALKGSHWCCCYRLQVTPVTLFIHGLRMGWMQGRTHEYCWMVQSSTSQNCARRTQAFMYVKQSTTRAPPLSSSTLLCNVSALLLSAVFVYYSGLNNEIVFLRL